MDWLSLRDASFFRATQVLLSIRLSDIVVDVLVCTYISFTKCLLLRDLPIRRMLIVDVAVTFVGCTPQLWSTFLFLKCTLFFMLSHGFLAVPFYLPILCVYLMGQMGLLPICQHPEEKCYDCFYAYRAAVRINVGLDPKVRVNCRVRFSFRFCFTVRVSVRVKKWLFHLKTVRQHKQVVFV